MIIKGFRVGPLLKTTGKEILNDNVLGLAAQAAYNAFFSIFPFFLFAAPLISLFGDKAEDVHLADESARDGRPRRGDRARAAAWSRTSSSRRTRRDSFRWAPLLALWSGCAVFGALMGTLNTAYHVTETRPWWKRALIQLASVLVMGLLVGIASIVMLAGPELAHDRWRRSCISIATSCSRGRFCSIPSQSR